jgi:inosine-uridine nucleoside N-ribohydrolase
MIKRVFVALIVLSISTYAQFIKPQLKFVEDTYDFGRVKQNDIVQHTFEFYNAGGDTLKIFDISASCGCSVGTLKKKEYAAGERGYLDVRFDSHGKFGNQVQRIYLRTNEPDNPTKVITIKAQVYIDTTGSPKIFFDKMFHNFGKIEEGKIYETSFAFTNTGQGILEIVDIHSSCGCTAAIPKKRILKSGEVSEVRVEFNSTNYNGLVTKYVTIRTNDPSNPEVILTIQADVYRK